MFPDMTPVAPKQYTFEVKARDSSIQAKWQFVVDVIDPLTALDFSPDSLNIERSVR